MNVYQLTESVSEYNFGVWTHYFYWPEAPWTMNAANNMHFRQEAPLRAEWRSAFELMSAGCAALESATVTVHHFTATRRKVDPCACMPAYKAALDGVVRGGVLTDDGPDFVRAVTFAAPVFMGRDALVLVLVGDELIAEAS